MNHQKIVETSLLTLLTGCALLGSSGYAFAADSKLRSGAECKPNGASLFTSTDFLYNVDGIKNKSAHTKTVICPLMQDAEGPYTPTEFANLDIRGIVNNKKSVSCTVTRGGFSVTKNTPVMSGGYSLFFEAPFNVLPGQFPNAGTGPVVVTCTLPSQATITQYTLREAGKTDS